MKIYILLTIFTIFYTTTTFAEPVLKMQDIKTVEDVKELRTKVIDRMTKRINSDQLKLNEINILEKRIALLSRKPLPTQEQIDWRIQNHKNIPSMKERIKNMKKFKRGKI